MALDAIERVEAAFVVLVGATAGVVSTFDHEPEKLGKRPCVTMLWVRLAPEDRYTGPAEDVFWEWRVNVYVDLGGRSGSNYRKAQTELRQLVQEILAVPRRDRTLGGVCVKAELLDEGEEPAFDHPAGLIWKSLRLRALTEET